MDKIILHMCFDKMQQNHLKQLEKFKDVEIPEEYIQEISDVFNKVFGEYIWNFYNEQDR